MPAADGPFRDAEAWLAERGVRREPLQVEPLAAEPVSPPPAEPVSSTAPPPEPTAGALHPREVTRLAAQADADRRLIDAERAATPTEPAEAPLSDEVARAVAFIRRSTSSAPQAEGRLRDKLGERDHDPRTIDLALAQARRERLVDDAAMAAALVEEKRRVGHAPARIRRDLRDRGFHDDVLDEALGPAEREDLESQAFAVAIDRARRLTAVPTETAFRRVHGHVARRGYPDALARKVARQAVFTTREEERSAGH